MKNILIFTFLVFSTSVFAQNNELVISFLPLHSDAYGQGVALTYYKNIYGKNAMGVRAGFNGHSRYSANDYDFSKNISVDIVNRWNLSKGNKFRFLTEVGISALRKHVPTIYNNYGCFVFCGNSTPEEINQYYEKSKKQKANYLGFVSTVGFDFQATKNISFGAGYMVKAYFTNKTDQIDGLNYFSNMSINSIIKF